MGMRVCVRVRHVAQSFMHQPTRPGRHNIAAASAFHVGTRSLYCRQWGTCGGVAGSHTRVQAGPVGTREARQDACTCVYRMFACTHDTPSKSPSTPCLPPLHTVTPPACHPHAAHAYPPRPTPTRSSTGRLPLLSGSCAADGCPAAGRPLLGRGRHYHNVQRQRAHGHTHHRRLQCIQGQARGR